MAKELILGPEVLHQIEGIKEADILVGIPSYNSSQTIGQVIRTVLEGLAKHFPDKRSVVVVCDTGSRDETLTIVYQVAIEDPRLILLSHSLDPLHKIITPCYGIPGRGSALQNILRIGEILRARACAIVDSDLRSITPEWIELLIKPVLLEDFDYVSPYYLRHKYDGTITNSIIYPLTRALYGKRLRQPIASDLGLSGGLASYYLTKDIWHTEIGQRGADVWMATTALAEGFRVCQSFLGARIQETKNHRGDLSSMLTQVVGPVFSLMENFEQIWFSIRGSEPLPIYGFHFEVGLQPVNVNLDRMVNAYKLGVSDLAGIWKNFLSVDVLDGLKNLSNPNLTVFRFQDALWAKVVFEFAVAYFKNKMDRDHLIKSLTPLYLGRTASFVLETQDSSAAEVENRIELLCLEYENLKPYLLEKWNG